MISLSSTDFPHQDLQHNRYYIARNDLSINYYFRLQIHIDIKFVEC
jgi:hypothetical protein